MRFPLLPGGGWTKVARPEAHTSGPGKESRRMKMNRVTGLAAVMCTLVMAAVIPAGRAQKGDAKSIEAAITKMEMEYNKAALAGTDGEWNKAHQAHGYVMGTSWGAWMDAAEIQKDTAD